MGITEARRASSCFLAPRAPIYAADVPRRGQPDGDNIIHAARRFYSAVRTSAAAREHFLPAMRRFLLLRC